MELDKEDKIPEHIAIIMDGNGRWAKKKGLPRNAGHVQGSRVVEKICKEAYDLGVKYLTVYAFSTENWKRPDQEVKALMKLLRNYLSDCLATSKKNNMQVRVLGDIQVLEPKMQEKIRQLEEVSARNTGLHFQVAINYGGRDELMRAVRCLARQVRDGEISLEELTEERMDRALDTRGIPDPDLLIRTSGEERLSNFLPWQLAYTEFYFTDVLWPDFSREDLIEAILHYSNRDRRFGGAE